MIHDTTLYTLRAHSPEWAAALHILGAPVLVRKDVHEYVHETFGEIDFPALWDASGPWSSGERLLIQAAWALFNGGKECDLGELVRRLDEGNMRRVLEAIRLFRA